MGRGDLTNAEGARLESFLLPGGARGGRWSDHRRVINGVSYRVRTGVQWRDLPERTLRAGSAGTCRWTRPRWGSPACRRREEGAARPGCSKGDSFGDEPGRFGAAETGRAAGGGGQIGECLGRSRGGFTTKIHLVADGRCRPLAFVVTPGHYGDGPQLGVCWSRSPCPGPEPDGPAPGPTVSWPTRPARPAVTAALMIWLRT
ncbi:transposase [Streptomyces flaveolus]|uniref:transposase n=1 Tax=Streptomyces flaveolus TaxID=67297 RepID=UPI00380B1D49